MKKIFFIIVITMLCISEAYAQDDSSVTIYNLGYYPENRYIDNCEDTSGCWYPVVKEYWSMNCTSIGQQYGSDTTLTIYGIASVFILTEFEDSFLNAWYGLVVQDTLPEHAFDTIMLFTFDSMDSIYPLRKLKCGYTDDIVRYLVFPYEYRRDQTLWHFYTEGVHCEGYECDRFPIREVFFDSALTISGEFYVAHMRCRRLYSSQRWNTLLTVSFNPVAFSTTCLDSNNFVWISTYPNMSEYKLSSICGRTNAIMSFFPILTPPAVDTTGHGGDTTAVDGVDGVGRYVSLSPNPAMDKVQVLSSFGLNQVEAYNAEGRLVYADAAHGLSKTIDLTAWPRGIYLVRIITPMGTTTKKLVLQ